MHDAPAGLALSAHAMLSLMGMWGARKLLSLTHVQSLIESVQLTHLECLPVFQQADNAVPKACMHIGQTASAMHGNVSSRARLLKVAGVHVEHSCMQALLPLAVACTHPLRPEPNVVP